MADTKSWQCPYCGNFQINTSDNHRVSTTLFSGYNYFAKNSNYGDVGLHVVSIACLNPECKGLTLTVGIKSVGQISSARILMGDSIKEWNLLPDSMAKPQPEYIPKPIREDYEEACKIAGISPKAAATLARRCLQGMIRDFCGISKQTLHSEIEKLKDEYEKNKSPQGVTMESIQAIDNVRTIGNIGAHMEKDVNTIVDIEPDEATLLIELIEMLFQEWYVARHKRDERLQDIQRSANQKKQQREKTSTTNEQQTPRSD